MGRKFGFSFSWEYEHKLSSSGRARPNARPLFLPLAAGLLATPAAVTPLETGLSDFLDVLNHAPH